jgi:hypothetical protein
MRTAAESVLRSDFGHASIQVALREARVDTDPFEPRTSDADTDMSRGFSRQPRKDYLEKPVAPVGVAA